MNAMRIVKYAAVFMMVLLLGSCLSELESDKIEFSDLVGVYEAAFDTAMVHRLTLFPDSTYEIVYVDTGGSRFEHEGRFVIFCPRNYSVNLEKFVEYLPAEDRCPPRAKIHSQAMADSVLLNCKVWRSFSYVKIYYCQHSDEFFEKIQE